MSRSYHGGRGYLWYSFLYHSYGKVMINHDTSSHCWHNVQSLYWRPNQRIFVVVQAPLFSQTLPKAWSSGTLICMVFYLSHDATCEPVTVVDNHFVLFLFFSELPFWPTVERLWHWVSNLDLHTVCGGKFVWSLEMLFKTLMHFSFFSLLFCFEVWRACDQCSCGQDTQ